MANRNRFVEALGICAASAFVAATSQGQQTGATAPAQNVQAPAAPITTAAPVQTDTPAAPNTAAPEMAATPRGDPPQPNIWYSNSSDPRNAYGQPNIWYSNSTDPAITYGQPSIWYSNSTDPRTSHNEGTVSWYSNSADPDPNRAATAGSFAEQPPPVWMAWGSTYRPATVSTEITPASPAPGTFVSPEAVQGPPVANGYLTPTTPLLGGNGTTATGAYTAIGPGFAPPATTGTAAGGAPGTEAQPAGTTTGVATPNGGAPGAPQGATPAPAGTAPAATGTAPAATTTAPAATGTAPAATTAAPAPAGTAPAATGTAPAPTGAGAPGVPAAGAAVATGAVSPAEAHQPTPIEQTAAHAQSAPETEATPEPTEGSADEHILGVNAPIPAAPVADQTADHTGAARTANTADHPAHDNATPARPVPGKLGSNFATVILKIAFVALLGLSLCVAATGIIIAVAFGLKGTSGRSQR